MQYVKGGAVNAVMQCRVNSAVKGGVINAVCEMGRCN